MELTLEELFVESIDVWVFRENTASTSLSFIDRIWNLLSRKARHQVRIYLLLFGFAAGLCSQGEHFFDKNLLRFVAFGILSRSLELCPHLVQFFAENDILIGIGSYLLVDLLLIQLFGSALDRFVLRENIYLTRICCDLSHLELCRVHWNCVHVYG